MNSLQVMKQTLAYLENGHFTYETKIADDLRAAIQQEVQNEPVAEVVQAFSDLTAISWKHNGGRFPPVGTKLYTHPPLQLSRLPGWRLVPIVMTRAMIDAYHGVGRGHGAEDDWAAMLEAAPQLHQIGATGDS
jgi:hypothetical protein